MNRFLLVLFLTLTTSFTASGRSIEDFESGVILKGKYIQDYQVFDNFLALFTDDIHATLRGEVLGFNVNDEEGLKVYQEFQEQLRLVDKRHKKALMRAWYKAHCTSSESFSTKSRARIFKDMGYAGDLQTKVTKRHLKRALKNMDEEVRINVVNYLKKLKETTTIFEVSNEEFLESTSTESMKSNYETRCINNSYDYHSNNGE